MGAGVGVLQGAFVRRGMARGACHKLFAGALAGERPWEGVVGMGAVAKRRWVGAVGVGVVGKRRWVGAGGEVPWVGATGEEPWYSRAGLVERGQVAGGLGLQGVGS